MPQLYVLSKGSRFDLQAASYSSKLTYIEVPLLFTYNTPVGFFVGTGPSISFGIGGNESVTRNGQMTTSSVKFDGKEDGNDQFSHYKRADVGGQVLACFHLPQGFFVNAHYSFGLSNVSPNDDSDGKIKNRYFGIGLGKFLGK
jgi:hypothetical protein